VQPDERVRGGTGLLQAQAICPAWAFYRYRLGARALGEPVEGLDALARGSLVHSMLEAFWRGRSSADLAAMSDMARAEAIETAIESALAAFNAERDEPLPVRIAALERERLATLAGTWLGIEADRPAAFQVAACEETHTLDIEGLPVRITIDRIDMLDDGRRVILDYKTGRAPDWASWAEPRILEPQLPVYAAWLAGDAGVDAVAFACLRAGEEGFSGIAAESGLLPDVPGLADKPGRKRFSETGFPNWKSVLTHWRNAIADVAQEVKAGVAAVVFEDEKALVYCEVKPLLRLAERRSQQEAAE
jgi:exodeoxyribonuclease-5